MNRIGWLTIIMVFALLFGGAARAGYGPAAAFAALGDRNNCSQINGTPYNSDDERNWFWLTCNGKAPPPATASSSYVSAASGGETVNPGCRDRELPAMQWTQLGPNCRVHSGDLYVSRNWQDPNSTILLQAGADIGLITKCNNIPCWVAPKVGGGLSGQLTSTLAASMGRTGCTGGCATIKECDFTACYSYAAPGRGGPVQTVTTATSGSLPQAQLGNNCNCTNVVTTAPAQTNVVVKTTGGVNCDRTLPKKEGGIVATVPYKCSVKGDIRLDVNGIWTRYYVNTPSAAHQTLAMLCMDPDGCPIRAEFGAGIGNRTLIDLQNEGCSTGCSVNVMTMTKADRTPIVTVVDDRVIAQEDPGTFTCKPNGGVLGRAWDGFVNDGFGVPVYPENACYGKYVDPQKLLGH